MAEKNESIPFDIQQHELVPRHEILSETEVKELLASYHIDPSQLPKILDRDPVALSIGAKPGQIVKIIRKSHTAKEAIAYRMVIETNK
jgi:DNA-directed RNA polymerase subunit H